MLKRKRISRRTPKYRGYMGYRGYLREGVSPEAKRRAADELVGKLKNYYGRDDDWNEDLIFVNPEVHNIREAGEFLRKNGYLISQYDNITEYIDVADGDFEQAAKWYIDDVRRNNEIGFTSEGLTVIDTM